MATLTWRPQALSDLESIEEYYADIAPDYASLLVDGLLEQAEQLEAFPRMGRIVPEIDDEDIRELIYRDYRLIYIADSENGEVNVLAVIHSSQHLGSLNSGHP
ncbi:MAG: type II toxin-antitoxin system RelE/ParE family toxin [Bacteroidetes bacterium QH_6_63_17]|nr:MAG: type II toxin-antitoxin system RelE/ParE family toxin [Bacteroidetes bacterium QH_6_63_17]